tara:strand:+ start:926 stop:1597 length:672 start_codon:yes stop_codon:yes gene_type:complete
VSRLKVLLPSARHLVTEELARGVVERYDEAAVGEHTVDFERRLDLGGFDDAVSAVMASHDAGDLSMDGAMAEAVHRQLRLSRREAADPGIWRYLAIVHRPEVVRHRWEYRSFATMRTRFWRHGTRFDANAFSRWWWVAELTVMAEDYSLTHRALGSSALSTHLFSRQLAWHHPTVAACVRILADAPGADVERTLRVLGKMLGLRVAEAMGREELEGLVRAARG